jgi:hypothetical protein
MRRLIAVAAFAALLAPAAAQQTRPQGQPSKPPAQAQRPPAPAPPPIFACRTAEEVCFLGIVTGKSQIAVLFTNAEKTDNIDAKPIEVLSGDAAGAPALDLAEHMGRVVMLTGTYDPQAGLTKAELVEVASPLVSLMVKAQLGAEEEPPPQAGKPRPPASPRR